MGILGKLKRRYEEYISFDLMISCLIRGIGLTVFFISEFSVWRTRREIFVPNPDDWYKYSYPKSETESVSDENLILLTALVPLIIHGFALSFLSSSANSTKKQIKFIFNQIVVYFLTGIVTNLLKQSIQRMRPDFIATCFQLNSHDLRALLLTGFNSSFPGVSPACTASETEIWKSMLSFPSGHSSLSFANFVYLALRMPKIPIENLFKSGSILESVLLSLPVVIILPAMHISLSRVIENRHHPEDIIAGAAIGSLIAFIVSKTEDLFFPEKQQEGIQAVENASDNLLPSPSPSA